VILGACAVDLEVPREVQVTCSSDDECPNGYQCLIERSRCIKKDAERVPPEFITGPNVEPPRVSRVPGYDGFAVTFTLGEDVDTQAASLRVDVGGQALESCQMTSESDGYLYICPATTGELAALGEGAHSVTVEAIDAAGNVTRENTAVTFDFSAPMVVTNSISVVLVAAPDNPLFRVDAITVGTTVDLGFCFDEEVLGAISVNTSSPVELQLTPLEKSGCSYWFEHTILQPAPPDGTYQVVVRATDTVGNANTTTLDDVFRVDVTPPASPNVEALGAVVYHRAPWGHAIAALRLRSGWRLTSRRCLRMPWV